MPRSLRHDILRRGFSLIEILVALGILAILLAILLPTLSRARESARRVSCQSNIRQLAQAWMLYNVDSRGGLCSADDGAYNGWVKGGNTENAMRNGALFKYLDSATVYRCSSNPDRSNLRTYSMNDHLNGHYLDQFRKIPRLRELAEISRASETMLFIEEFDPRGYNVNGCALDNKPDAWIDIPATWHYDGLNIAFADGHAEQWTWSDPRTAKMTKFHEVHAGSKDQARMRAAMGF